MFLNALQSILVLSYFSVATASVKLNNTEPLVMDLKRSYLIDANTVLEFSPPTLKIGLDITNESSSDDLIIKNIVVTISYTHNGKELVHTTAVSPKNIINIDTDQVYIDTFSLSENSILKLKPNKTIRLGGLNGWVILENLIPKNELGYGDYMDVKILESKIQLSGYYLNQNNKQKKYAEVINFNPIKR